MNKIIKKRIPWNKGKKGIFSKAALKKIGKAHKGKIQSLKTKKLISKNHAKWNKGLTKETNKSLLNASIKLKGRKNEWLIGKKLSKETKAKISKIHKGKIVSKETCLKISKAKKGFKHIIESRKKISKNNAKTMLGKKHSNKTKEKMRQSFIKYHSIDKQLYPWYNKNACIFFDKLNKLYNLQGQHAENNNEKKVIGYFIDFYSKKHNLIIEWNEEQHYFQNRLIPKHINRQNQIKRKLKCNWINIRQKTFKEENIFKRIENILRKNKIKIIA